MLGNAPADVPTGPFLLHLELLQFAGVRTEGTSKEQGPQQLYLPAGCSSTTLPYLLSPALLAETLPTVLFKSAASASTP
jgi:hypothetical protein